MDISSPWRKRKMGEKNSLSAGAVKKKIPSFFNFDSEA